MKETLKYQRITGRIMKMKNKFSSNLWVLLPIRSVFFLLIFSFGSMITNNDFNDIVNWWSVVACIVNIITIGILLAVCKSCNISYGELIHYKKGKEKVSKGILFIFMMLVLGMGGMYLSGWLCYGQFPYLAPMMIAPIPIVLAVVNVVALPITTTLAEDGLYLGCGVNKIQSKWAAILLPAFFYALQHSFIPTILDIRYIIYRFLSFLPLTIWICYQYHRKKNPTFIMIGHWLLNMATAIQILATSAMPELYETMLNL